MRVLEQVLSPGVQDGEETDAGTQVFGVAGNGPEGSGAGIRKGFVDDPGIVQRQIVESVSYTHLTLPTN